MKEFWSKVKERLSSDNISDTWKKVRNIAGGICTAGGLILAIPESIITFPVVFIAGVQYVTLVAGAIAGRAQLNTGKKMEYKNSIEKAFWSRVIRLPAIKF
jgi:hypothetical protein